MRQTVYWLLGPGARVRHAVEFGPGSFPGGQLLPTVCNRWIKVPFGAPSGGEDISRKINERCGECTEAITPHKPSEVVWDA
ncbi:hypothetical protein [Parasphingorhabdus pacifica]